MANTVVQAVVTKFLTDGASPDTAIKYPYFVSTDYPYTYLLEIGGADRVKPFLCDDRGGETVLQVGHVSKGSYQANVDKVEDIIGFMKGQLYGQYTDLEIWNVVTTAPRDVSTIEEVNNLVYHRQFDARISWRYKS